MREIRTSGSEGGAGAVPLLPPILEPWPGKVDRPLRRTMVKLVVRQLPDIIFRQRAAEVAFHLESWPGKVDRPLRRTMVKLVVRQLPDIIFCNAPRRSRS